MASAGRNIEDWINEFNLRTKNLSRFLEKEIKSSSGILVLKPLKLRLFNQGTDGTGHKLEQYTDAYALRKRKRGVRAHPTNLRLTGSWYKSMFVSVKISPFRTEVDVLTNQGAKDEPQKTEFLRGKYGDDILSLTKEEQKQLIEVLEKRVSTEFNSIKLPTINFK